MHYFITGATGLIGSAFIHSLGHEAVVSVLTRNMDNAKSVLKNVRCSIDYVNTLSALDNLNHVDCVINLAGEPIADKRWTSSQKHHIQQSRWSTTSGLVSLITASSTPPDVFISGSAIGFYGRQGQKRITESQYEVHKEFTHSLCSTWESIAQGAQNESTRVCLLRTGIVLAEGEGALGKMTLPFKLGLGGRIGNGDQGMSWIHLDDMVKGIHFLISQPSLSGPFNFTAPQPESNARFVKALAKTLNRPAIFPMPAPVLRLLMGESADLLVTGQYVLPKKLEQAGFVFSFPSLKGALTNLLIQN